MVIIMKHVATTKNYEKLEAQTPGVICTLYLPLGSVRPGTIIHIEVPTSDYAHA